MRHTMHKLFFAWDFEKEEAWLNEMSAKGLQLVSVGFCKYQFEEGERGEYTYRLELLENLPSNPESVSYIRFLEETGVEHIGSVLRWVYFRKKAADGKFEIYSDIDSRIRHYRRILLIFFAVTPINIMNIFNTLNSYLVRDLPVYLVYFVLSSVIVLLLSYGILKMIWKIHRLKKEKIIRE
jgi:hypothetical protein